MRAPHGLFVGGALPHSFPEGVDVLPFPNPLTSLMGVDIPHFTEADSHMILAATETEQADAAPSSLKPRCLDTFQSRSRYGLFLLITG